jgi:phage gp36-like protein
MYCTEQDLIDRFGEREVRQLSDRGNATAPHLNSINSVRVQAAIDDACAFINRKLTCCYDVCYSATLYAGGGSVALLKAWCCDIARYRLYDSIRLKSDSDGGWDHESYRRYKIAVEEIKEVCECGGLMDDTCTAIPVTNATSADSAIAVTERDSCMPKVCCNNAPDCCCSGAF